MIKYIIINCWMSYVYKNKLHEHVVASLDKSCQYQTLADDAALEKFLQDLKNKVDKANALFPRCKPVKVQVNKMSLGEKQILVYVDGKGGGFTFARYQIEKIRKEWEVSNEC